ncbi:MAG: type II toxin-antitoxin system HicB family antitoxin [Candidatus Omnitrophica bacterium]|nr:type II toxin-antitoxin system HicB family antitoxin [Candidatus Omnitrophota bacterium]
METYSFRVIVEQDEKRWHAYCPALEKYGAVTWGNTREEALKNIEEVVQMVVEEIIEDNKILPYLPPEEVTVFHEPRVAVTV